MTRLLVTLFSLFLVTSAAAQERTYALELLLDGNPVGWDPGEGIGRNGEFFTVDDPAVPLTVYFEGGRLELRLADFGTFSQPHVTGIRFGRGMDPQTLSLGATVQHRSEDPDDYADTIAFDGAEGGRLTVEPHDETRAFTRSKEGMRVGGEVRFSALDSPRSGDGSAIVVDFSQRPFSGLERGTLRYELVLQPEN